MALSPATKPSSLRLLQGTVKTEPRPIWCPCSISRDFQHSESVIACPATVPIVEFRPTRVLQYMYSYSCLRAAELSAERSVESVSGWRRTGLGSGHGSVSRVLRLQLSQVQPLVLRLRDLSQSACLTRRRSQACGAPRARQRVLTSSWRSSPQCALWFYIPEEFREAPGALDGVSCRCSRCVWPGHSQTGSRPPVGANWKRLLLRDLPQIPQPTRLTGIYST